MRNTKDTIYDLRASFPKALAYYNSLFDEDKNNERIEKKQREILTTITDMKQCVKERYILSDEDTRKKACYDILIDHIETIEKNVANREKVPEFIASYNAFNGSVSNFMNVTSYHRKESSYFFMMMEDDLIYSNSNWNGESTGFDQEKEIFESIAGDIPRNVLVYRANQRESYASLKADFEDRLKIYGTISNDRSFTIEKRKALDGVAIGPSKSFYITNDSMDIAIARSMNFWDVSVAEKEIFSTKNRLREGGFFIIETPDFFMRPGYAAKLASSFEVVGSYLIPQTIMPDMKYLGIVFQKKSSLTQEEIDENYAKIWDVLKRQEPLDVICQRIKKCAPITPVKKKIFIYGDGADQLLIDIIFKESPLSMDSIKEAKAESVPVLPLKQGQIAQVLASGMLNGVIDEGNGYKHVIRGCIYKGSHVKPSTIEEDSAINGEYIRTTKTIVNNMVEINMFTGSGMYKKIQMS